MARNAIQSGFKLILGSQSKARRQILREMGYDFTIITADIDEKSIRREKHEDLVVAIAEAKAEAIISNLHDKNRFADDPQPTLLITADTVVVYDGVVREKPSSKEEAREFIKSYSGYRGGVVGSVIVTNLQNGERRVGWDKAEVYFHEIPDEIIDKLIEDGISLKVAGGLTLDHPLTSPLVDTVVGAYDTVRGLTKALTQRFIEEVL